MEPEDQPDRHYKAGRDRGQAFPGQFDAAQCGFTGRGCTTGWRGDRGRVSIGSGEDCPPAAGTDPSGQPE